MNREQIDRYNGNLEAVTDENGTILFAKSTKKLYQYVEDVEMAEVCGYGLLTSIEDVGFCHLEGIDFPKRSIVDFRYYTAAPDKLFSHSKIGTLTVLDADTQQVYTVENFQGSEWQKPVSHGEEKFVDTYGLNIHAANTLKEFIGKNLSEVKNSTHHK